jgi:hypothetical protein
MGVRRCRSCAQPSSALARFFGGCGSPGNGVPKELSAGRCAISSGKPVATDIEATQGLAAIAASLRSFHRTAVGHVTILAVKGDAAIAWPSAGPTDGMVQIYQGTCIINNGVITQADVKHIS